MIAGAIVFVPEITLSTRPIELEPEAPANHVVISEVFYNQANPATDRDEFIEFYNPTGSAVSMANWALAHYNQAGALQWNYTFLAGASIASHGFYLLGQRTPLDPITGASPPDWNYVITPEGVLPAAMQNGPDDYLTLWTDTGSYVDGVRWGHSADTPPLIPDTPTQTSVASNPAAGRSIERRLGYQNETGGNGEDTDDNSADFITRGVPTPQNSANATEAPGDVPGTPATHVVINEILYNAKAPDETGEWVEIMNPSTSSVNIAGWTIDDDEGTWTIPAGCSIGAGNNLTLAKNGARFYQDYGYYPDFEFSGGTPAIDLGYSGDIHLSNTGELLFLNNSSGTSIDIVVWGSSTYGTIVPVAASVLCNQSITRCPDGNESETAPNNENCPACWVTGTVPDPRTFDSQPPNSTVSPIIPYWCNSQINITAVANDTLSGLAKVTLWHRFSTDKSFWDAWTPFGLDTGVLCSWSFDFPPGEGYYEFYTEATDVAGNVEVAPSTADAYCAYDLTRPNIVDNSPTNSSTGDSYVFRVVVTDNLNLSAVRVVYWYGSGTETNATMNHTTANNYEFGITISLNSLSTLHSRILAVDMAGNWNSTATKDVVTNDNDDPVANAGSDQAVDAGTIVTFNGSGSTDNIGIANYTWTFTHNGMLVNLYGLITQFNFTLPGNYTVTLIAVDAAGNFNNDTLNIQVNHLPLDTDSDGIPDYLDDDNDGDGFLDDWEELLGTENDPNEAPLDTDNDGIPNGDENNSLPWMDTDDDGDGVPDSEDPYPLDSTLTTDTMSSAVPWIVGFLAIVIVCVIGALSIYWRFLKRQRKD